MKKLMRVVFSRLFIVGAAIIIQALALVLLIWKFSDYFAVFYAICSILSLAAVLFIANGQSNPSYKIAWIIPIMVFPIFGGLFYILLGGNKISNRNKRKLKKSIKNMSHALGQEFDVLKRLENEDITAANQTKYIYKYAFSPVYSNTYSQYLPSGEKKFEVLLDELKKAKKYIFLEYFIIEQGVMWNSILQILQDKVKQGVDVRVIYDDMGCLLTLPFGYQKKLEDMGIKCAVFNRFIPILSSRVNNRDHRKIAVIDGCVAFTGGINLADEYINVFEKHGHWLDASIVIYGDAAWSFTVMFLSMWGFLKNSNEDFNSFKPNQINFEKYSWDGFAQPFNDSPLDDEPVGEGVYLNLLGCAKKYVYINTPYLILDNKMSNALSLAAKRGVDVRIITPHIPDKWYVHAVSRSNYETLINSGVKIYEYTPGFDHAKTFVVDDEFAVVGTINLDYRSLFLHFECAVWLYKTSSVLEVKNEYVTTLKNCQLYSLDQCKNIGWHRKLGRAFLRIFAPLM